MSPSRTRRCSPFSASDDTGIGTGIASGDLKVVNFDNVVAGNPLLPHYGAQLTGDEPANVLQPTSGSYATLAGGPGDDHYVFPSQFGVIAVVEEASNDSGQGHDSLDFSAVTEDLTFSITADGSLAVSYTEPGGVYAVVSAVGVESLIGGSGINTLDYSAYLGGGVDVDLAVGCATISPRITGFTRVIGTSANDTILGDSAANMLSGGEGDDLIGGTGGVDELSGGAGVDTLIEQQDADMELTNNTFTIDGVAAVISGFELAELAGGPTSNIIDAAAFTGLTAGTPLEFLNHGVGVRRHGSLADFEITLVDGTVHAVNLAYALTLQDVLDALSAHAQLDAQLAADGTGIIISDMSVRSGANVTTVTPLNGSIAALDLGLTTDGTPAVLVGMEIPAGRVVLKGGLFVDGRETIPLSLLELGPEVRTTDVEFLDLRGAGALASLSDLNNGDGVELSGFQITLSDGTSVGIDVSGAASVQDVLDKINQAHDDLAAYIGSHGRGIVIRDDSDGEGSFKVIELGGTSAADLGILGTGEGNYVEGEHISRVAADIRFSFFDGTHVDVDLSGLATVVDVMDRITAAHADLSAVVNADGTGIDVVHNGGGAVTVADINDSFAATDLGIAGSVGSGVIHGVQIVGSGGSPIRLDGRFDSDTLIGSRGNDRLTGGGGSDTLRDKPGDPPSDDAELIVGSEGTDWLTSVEQARLTGGKAGDQVQILDASGFTLGPVTLATGGGRDTLKGSSHADRFEVDVSDGAIFGDPATDYVQIFVNGGSHNEVAITGTPQSASQMDLEWVRFVSASDVPVYPPAESAVWTVTG